VELSASVEIALEPDAAFDAVVARFLFARK
jgi:hypothetical protein